MSVGSVISQAAHKITGAIGQAARSTGISFDYLITTAHIESRFNPKAKAPTSSATGLYQFIDQTWLATLKKAGPSLGLGEYAKAIGKTASGRYTVTDPDMRPAIMRLRQDPRASALMAGAFTRANEARLASRIGRQPTEGELYMAHFLGSGGAGKLISAAANQPQASAVDMFPRAARANHNIFYDRQGHARSVAGVYRTITRHYQTARNTAAELGLLRGTVDPTSAATSQLAAASASISATMPEAVSAPTRGAQVLAAAPQAMPEPVRETEAFAMARGAEPAPAPPVADPAGTTRAYVVAPQERPAAAQSASGSGGLPLFRAMFSDRAGEPVAPTVQHLWSSTKMADAGQATARTAARTTTEAAAAPGQLRPLDLFADHPRDPRALFGTRKA